jgi:hypothetical protein
MVTTVDQAIATREHPQKRYTNLTGLGSRVSAPFNVSLREPAAVSYWCRHFNTTPERLFDAVTEVGSNPAIIRLHLRKR